MLLENAREQARAAQNTSAIIISDERRDSTRARYGCVCLTRCCKARKIFHTFVKYVNRFDISQNSLHLLVDSSCNALRIRPWTCWTSRQCSRRPARRNRRSAWRLMARSHLACTLHLILHISSVIGSNTFTQSCMFMCSVFINVLEKYNSLVSSSYTRIIAGAIMWLSAFYNTFMRLACLVHLPWYKHFPTATLLHCVTIDQPLPRENF